MLCVKFFFIISSLKSRYVLTATVASMDEMESVDGRLAVAQEHVRDPFGF